MKSKNLIYALSVLAGVATLIMTTQPQKGSLVDMALALAGGSAGPGDSGSGDDGHNDTGGQHGGSGDTGGRDHGDGGYGGSPGMGPGPSAGYNTRSMDSLASVDTMTQADIDADLANMRETAPARAALEGQRAMLDGMVAASERDKAKDRRVATSYAVQIGGWVVGTTPQAPGTPITQVTPFAGYESWIASEKPTHAMQH